jgi:hypothetical protein
MARASQDDQEYEEQGLCKHIDRVQESETDFECRLGVSGPYTLWSYQWV